MIKLLGVLIIFILYLIIKGIFQTSKSVVKGGTALVKGYINAPQLKENRARWLDSFNLEEAVFNLNGWMALARACDDYGIFTQFIDKYNSSFDLTKSDPEQGTYFFNNPVAFYMLLKESTAPVVVDGQDFTKIVIETYFIGTYLGRRDALNDVPYESLDNLKYLVTHGTHFSFEHLKISFKEERQQETTMEVLQMEHTSPSKKKRDKRKH